MRRLMLLRHAKTETDAPSGRDQDRRLDERGRKDAAEIGRWVAAHPPFPDAVLVSPAVRAHQTWEIAWAEMKETVPAPQLELLPELYGADAAQLLQSIREASVYDPKRLMLVGHNPGMHELAMLLASSSVASDTTRRLVAGFPTAALAEFSIATQWQQLDAAGTRLVRFLRPKDLPEAAT